MASGVVEDAAAVTDRSPRFRPVRRMERHEMAIGATPSHETLNAMMPQHVGAPAMQVLVRFQNTTYVWNRSPSGAPTRRHIRGSIDDDDDEDTGATILTFVSKVTGWPTALLRVASVDLPFCNVRVTSSIRGGKGGFGTLLKGQSRQAANQTTLDYGSCRDLQGRRLRSVNDEIAQRLHREWQHKVDTGQATKQDMVKALSDTNSGIAGWFLQLPAWAEKGTRKVARRQHHQQYQAWKRSEQERQRAKDLRRQAEERVVASYVQATNQSVEAITSHLQQAVQQGLMASKEGMPSSRKRKMNDEAMTAEDGTQTATNEGDHGDGEVAKSAGLEENNEKQSDIDSDPTCDFVTLSGEVVQVPPGDNDESSASCPKLQGASNFATVGVLLRDAVRPSSPSLPAPVGSLYYEVVVHSGGLVQVGWVADPGQLNSESGDGAGDVPGSWSYDGSRRIKMRTSYELPSSSSSSDPKPGAKDDGPSTSSPDRATSTSTSEYGVQWKAGDVVGCMWNYADGSLRYFVNGEDMGVAFEDVRGASTASLQHLVPAVSINPGEVVELRLHRKDFQHFPSAKYNATPVGALLLEQVLSLPDSESAAPSPESAETTDGTIDLDQERKPAAATSPANRKQKDVTNDGAAQRPLDLSEFDSVDSLVLLGMDRLKAALQSRGLKCGGTANERAARLFAVKGLAPDQYPTKLLAKK